MSRGFVKEADYVEPAPAATGPAAITADAMASLARELDAAGDAAQRAGLERRIAARFVPEPPADRRVAAFGSTVRVQGAAAEEREFRIVGDDEVDVGRGLIGAASPLAQALLGARAGDVVVWHRPAGDRSLRVTSVRYGR